MQMRGREREKEEIRKKEEMLKERQINNYHIKERMKCLQHRFAGCQKSDYNKNTNESSGSIIHEKRLCDSVDCV